MVSGFRKRSVEISGGSSFTDLMKIKLDDILEKSAPKGKARYTLALDAELVRIINEKRLELGREKTAEAARRFLKDGFRYLDEYKKTKIG